MNTQLAGRLSTNGVKNTEFLLDEARIVKFWNKVKKSEGCWEWVGSRNQQGYGQFCVNRVPRPSHRVSYELHFGPFNAKMCICHRCDNPPCIRPDHLFLGSHQDNVRDAIRKGRMKYDWASKLNKSDVIKIRELAERGGLPLDIANAFLVTRQCIMDILSGRNRSTT